MLWARYENNGGGRKRKIAGTAKPKDIEPLMAKAITDKARSLRPSVKTTKHIDARDTGILLGNLQRPAAAPAPSCSPPARTRAACRPPSPCATCTPWARWKAA